MLQIEKSIDPRRAVKTPAQIGERGAQRVVDNVHHAARHRLRAVVNPGRHAEGDAVDGLPRLEQLPGALQPALRQFLRTVHGDLPQAMLQAVVGKPCAQIAGITRHINAGRQVQGRRRFFIHVAADKAQQIRVTDGLEHRFMPCQQPDVSHQRMAAVEHAQLHGFERPYIGHHLHALHFPVRAPLGEVVLDHPLAEAFTHHRRRVMAIKLLHKPGEGLGVHGGHDAIDHATRKRHLLFNPLRQLAVVCRRQTAHGLAGALAVVGHVVATQYGECRDACFVPSAQGFEHNSRRSARRLRVFKVVNDRRVLQLQLAAGRAQVIAFLGHGERDDPGVRVGHALQQLLQFLPAIPDKQRLTHHRDVAQGHLFAVLVLRHRIAVVLLAQLLDQRPVGAQVGTAHAPGAVTVAIEMTLHIHRLMSAVKRSQTQMHNPDFGLGRDRGHTLNNRHRDSPQSSGLRQRRARHNRVCWRHSNVGDGQRADITRHTHGTDDGQQPRQQEGTGE